VLDRDGLHVVESAPREPAPGWWPDDAVVALIHGTMDRSAGMARLARRLDDATVVRYDRRGYGRSRELGPGGLEEHVHDLFAVLDGRRAVLAGHSFGGVVALAAAVLAPRQIRSVFVYEAPSPLADWWTRWDIDAAGPGEDPAGDAAELFLRRMLGDRLWERLPARTRAERRAEGASMIAEITSLQVPDLAYDPSLVSVPVVVSYGSATGPRHRRSAEWLAERIPDAELICVAGADHGAPLTHPAELADLVRHTARRATLG